MRLSEGDIKFTNRYWESSTLKNENITEMLSPLIALHSLLLQFTPSPCSIQYRFAPLVTVYDSLPIVTLLECLIPKRKPKEKPPKLWYVSINMNIPLITNNSIFDLI